MDHAAAYSKYVKYCREVAEIEPMSMEDWAKQRGWNLSTEMNSTPNKVPVMTLGTPGNHG